MFGDVADVPGNVPSGNHGGADHDAAQQHVRAPGFAAGERPQQQAPAEDRGGEQQRGGGFEAGGGGPGREVLTAPRAVGVKA